MAKIITFKSNRKIIAYIRENAKGFVLCTGKPSDMTCLSWQYSTLQEAKITAVEYTENYTNG